MAADDYLRIQSLPDLREPFLLAAFAGWNDASQVATHALTSLVNSWGAGAFATIDPEDFFDFTESRPTISLGPSGQRFLLWPANTFFWHRLEEAQRDVVLLVGSEPQLKWRTFCRLILEVAERTNASCLVTLGGLLADVPHTVEPRLTGYVTRSDMLPDLRALGLRASRYEGPTGILGALHDAWRPGGKPSLSLWGNVPHYISASPNPQVSLALLRRIETVLRAPLPLAPLEAQEAAFRSQVDEALVQNPDATQYVRELEEHYAEETPPPPGPEVIAEVEEFLRRRRPDGEDEE